MITQEQLKQGAELKRILLEQAWSNPEFKSKLIAEPRKAISLMIGDNNSSIQSNKKIVVEDQTDKSIIYINIPFMPNLDELELTQEQLEMVSGGASTWGCVIAVVDTVVSLFSGSGGDDNSKSNTNVQVGSNNSNTQS